VAAQIAIDGLTRFSDDQAYQAMDFLLEVWPRSPVRCTP
jgi:hypothetical protein